MGYKTKLFLILCLAGFIGVLSFQLVDFPALIAQLPWAAERPLNVSESLLRVLSVLQPTVLLAIAVFAGVRLAPRVGLSAPLAEAWAAGRPLAPALRPQLLPGIAGGVIGGAAVIGAWILFKPFLPAAFVRQAEGFNRLLPALTRFLYGGVTEELLLRWGLMTFLVWVLWRTAQKGQGSPRPAWFVAAIAISAFAFGAGHLPLGIALAGGPTWALVSYVVAANSAFALVAGYLYWRRGLESAVVAHMAAHVVLIAALAVID